MNKRNIEITEQEAQSRLAAMCAKAEHCTGEMREKMWRWGLDEQAQKRVTDWLVKNKYVDDERFCRLFVRDKIKYNKWGRRKVEQALYSKRVSKDIYEPILNEFEADEYVEILRPLLENKRRSIKANSEYERNMKLIRFALSRGFDINVIKKCISDADELPED